MLIVLKETPISSQRIGGVYMDRDPFKEYIRESEPEKRDKGYAWHTAIGLQAVDGLKTSQYLVDTRLEILRVIFLLMKLVNY